MQKEPKLIHLEFDWSEWVKRRKNARQTGDELTSIKDELKTTFAQTTINNSELRSDIQQIHKNINEDPHSRTVLYQLQEYSRVVERMMDTVINMAERAFAMVDKTMEYRDKQLFEQRAASRRWFWIAMSLAATLFWFFFSYWISSFLGFDMPFI